MDTRAFYVPEWVVLVALYTLWSVGCSDGSPTARAPERPLIAPNDSSPPPDVPDTPASGTGSPSAGPPTPEAKTPTYPVLDAQPGIDLLHNRHRLHLYDRGLIVPMASEGFHKYSQEYRLPWGRVLDVEGMRGRVLRKRKAVLRVPVERAGTYTIAVRMYNPNGRQKLRMAVNGARPRVVTPRVRPAEDDRSTPSGWQRFELTDVELTAGDNQLALRLARRHRFTDGATDGSTGGSTGGARRVRSYGLWHSIEIAPAVDAVRPEAAPVRSPVRSVSVDGQEREALAGYQHMDVLIEVPARAWLDVYTGSRAAGSRFQIQVAVPRYAASERVETLDTSILLKHEQTPGTWTRHRLSLAELANRLVRLRLSVDGTRDAIDSGAWGTPRIALEQAEIAPFEPVRNVILLVIDTLRADKLSLYGDTRVQTRHLDTAAARGSAVFLHNQAASPSSPPSHTSIHTGMVPRAHGVSGDQAPLAPNMPLLSALLRDAGFIAGYVGNNNFAMSRLKKRGNWHSFYEPVFNRKGVDCKPVMQGMLAFVDKHGSERFFLSGLPLEPHLPYRFHEGITDTYFAGPYDRPIGKRPGSALISRITSGKQRMNETRWKQVRALYDGEVHYMDACFGELMAGLEQRGRLSDTAIVVTADHGEGMYEHKRMGHAFGHFAELSNVPFVILWPSEHGMANGIRSYHTVTSLIDIAPTVLSLLGQAHDPRMQGRDMVPVMRRQGPWPNRVVAMEYGRSYALRARDWKYIVEYSGREHLYHVARDPTEQHNLSTGAPLALRYMRENAGFYLGHRDVWRAADWGDLNNHGPAAAAANE